MSIVQSPVHFDGDYTQPVQHGHEVYTRDPETWALLAARTMHQLEDKRKELPIGWIWNTNYYLYEETTPKDLGGGIVEWVQLYAQIPPFRIEQEPTDYSYQFVIANEISEIPISTTAAAVYTYGLIPPVQALPISVPTQLNLQTARKLIKVGINIVGIGDPIDPASPYLLARDSVISRWRGIIWQRKNLFVFKRQLSAQGV